MIVLSLCFFLYSQVTLDSPIDAVMTAAKEVIVAKGFEIAETTEQRLTTHKLEMDANKMQDYIIEQYPCDNPGWMFGHMQIFISIESLGRSKAKLMVNVFFELYGTPSALLSIPPTWSEAFSNGKLERELLDEIINKLSAREEK